MAKSVYRVVTAASSCLATRRLRRKGARAKLISMTSDLQLNITAIRRYTVPS